MTFAMRLNGGDLMRDGEGVKHDGGFTVTVMKNGTRFGNGDPLIKTINTLSTNGSWEKISRFGNRAPALIVKIEGETPAGLNAGGNWLSSLMGSGALEWLPPDQQVWTVFDVVSCYIDLTEDEGWDLDETKWIRKYRIPIKALPHSRSRELTLTPALPLASTPIVDELVTDASSATGWTGAWSGKIVRSGDVSASITPEVVSGRVRVAMPSVERSIRVVMTSAYTFADPVPADTPVLQVDYRLLGATTLLPATVSVGGGASMTLLPMWATAVDPGTGAGTAYYRLPDGVTALTMRATVRDYEAAGAMIEVDQVRRLSRLPDSGTNRQKVAAITPGGSAPAEGSLHVSHPSAGLGKVLIFTYPLGRPSPELMQHRYASATPAADEATVNGNWIALQTSPLVLRIPDAQLPTRGRATLWARLRVDSAPATVRCLLNTQMPPTIVGKTQTHEVTVGNGSPVLVPLGLFTLPGATTGPAGVTIVNIARLSGGDVFVDGVWAGGQDEESALTIVDCGTGTPASGGPSNHMWINAPTGETPAGEILIGTSLSDARWPSLIQAGPEIHRFGRDGVACLTVTCGATDASTDFAHFKRWDHFAAEES